MQVLENSFSNAHNSEFLESDRTSFYKGNSKCLFLKTKNKKLPYLKDAPLLPPSRYDLLWKGLPTAVWSFL